jgi:GTP-binding protein Era
VAHKAGFVNIIGNPNAGKSTLMNALMGRKMSIVTPKAQTTRHRIMGIWNDENFQIIYSDTPGVLDPKYKLQEGMMKSATSAFLDADLLILVVDVSSKEEVHAPTLSKISNANVPVFVVLNKMDLVGTEGITAHFDKWKSILPNSRVLPASALAGIYTKELVQEILKEIPESPAYFPKDEMSDRTMRFFVSEIIREKIFLLYDREVPYCTEVEVEAYEEETDIIRISAIIYCERDSQKGILIGHQGSMLKKVGTKARKDIEEFVGKQVFLKTHIKVDANWRNNVKRLKNMGYMD